MTYSLEHGQEFFERQVLLPLYVYVNIEIHYSQCFSMPQYLRDHPRESGMTSPTLSRLTGCYPFPSVTLTTDPIYYLLFINRSVPFPSSSSVFLFVVYLYVPTYTHAVLTPRIHQTTYKLNK